MKTAKDFYMESVGDITLKAHKVIEGELGEYGITLTDRQSDEIWDAIWMQVEKYSNGNYGREM